MPRKSNDLRKLIVDAVRQGKSKKWIIESYKTTYETINSYMLLDEQGKLFDIVRKGGVASKIDMDKLKEYLTNNPTKAGWQIGLEFGIKQRWATELALALLLKKYNNLQRSKARKNS